MSQFIPQKIIKFLTKYHGYFYKRTERWRSSSMRKKRETVEKKIILNAFKKKSFPTISQFKHLGCFLTTKEKGALYFFIALTLIAFSGLLGLWYFGSTVILPAKGGEYIEGVVGYPRFINSLYSQTNEADKDLVELVYSGLVSRNIRGGIDPDLAKSFKISEDEKIYTFTLREDVYWHDGKKFNADDVVFTINAIKNKEYASPLRDSWNGIAVEKIDDYTVQFKLNEVFSSFLSLASIKILPKHIWEKIPVASINLAEANNKPVGTGPYRFKSFTKDKVGVIRSYRLEKNDKYHNEEPSINIIVLKFYPDYISAVNALDNKQIDALAFIPGEARDLLKLKSRLESYNITLPQYNAIFFNSSQNSILKSKSVRLALESAIDKKKIIKEALGGDGEILEDPVLPGFLSFKDSKISFLQDLEKAKKLLVLDGWILKDGNMVREKGEDKLKIKITTLEKDQNVKALSIIKDGWEAIGLEVEVEIVSAGDISKDIISKREYEALLFGAMLGPDLDLYSYWHSSAIKYPGLNLAQYSNRQTDVLLEQARRSMDKVIKQKKYEEFSSLLGEDSPAIFLWQPTYVYLIDKKVHGVQMGALATPSDRFLHIISGFINTKRVLK